jgi:nicotinamide phosphoribosyltransferase
MASTPTPSLACNGNPLLCTDSYKVTHHDQYPANTTKVFSYFESRGGVFKDVVFFGLQYLLKQWMLGPVVTEERIAEAKEYYDKHFGSEVFNEAGWRHILEKHDGHLPMKIRAVPEGTVLPYKNVLFTCENTDPKCFWLCTWFETLLVQCWYPLTVASLSRAQKVTIKTYMQGTADDEAMAGLGFKLHDFGFRGTTCAEAAAIGGAAHLVNFMGSDTVAALTCAREVYGLPADQVAGFSIPASEHSTITSWGSSKEQELAAFTNMLDKFPTGLVACVSDSYNIWDAIKTLWGTTLKEKVMSREGKGTLVVRPDSGHPPEVVIKCLELLGSAFGTTVNSKGFKMLPSYVRLIQGDGIDVEMLKNICGHLALFGWSVDNVAFGSGGGLLQKVNRDTQKCAYKCSWVEVDGVARDVQKNPISDAGKKSKKGRLTLEVDGASFKTVENGDPSKDILQTVFENGKLLVDQKYAEIRERAEVKGVGPLPEFTSSEPWVAEMDAWAAEYEIKDWVSKPERYTSPEVSVAAGLATIEEGIGKGNMTKAQLAEALQALNKLNQKLLGVAENFKK